MNKKVLIIIVALVVVGGAAFVFLSGMLGGQEAVDKPVELSYYIPGESFVTNVLGSQMLLKTNISLGFDKTSMDANLLKEQQSAIREIIVRELRTLTEEDIADPFVLDDLKERLLAGIRDGMGYENLHDIKFSDFVAQ